MSTGKKQFEGSPIQPDDQNQEFLDLVQRGDKNAIAALERARKEVSASKNMNVTGSKVTDNPRVIDNPIIQDSFGTKNPEFMQQVAMGDSAGGARKEILQRALEILQSGQKIENPYTFVEELMHSESPDKPSL